MIAADLLTLCSGLDNEVDVSAGGSDEARMIITLNLAIDYCEAVAASLPRVLSTRGVNPIQTAAQTESTLMPAELLRLDKLWMLDPSSGLPLYPMQVVREVGGHMPSVPWPLNYIIGGTTAAGMPRAYYADASHIYWNQLPDAVYSVRAYGLWAVEMLKDRTSALPPHWPDSLAFPVAAFAVKYGQLALDDPTDEIAKAATEVFTPVLRALRRRDRSSASSRIYEYSHST